MKFLRKQWRQAPHLYREMWKLLKFQVSYYNQLEFSLIKDDLMVFSNIAVLDFMRMNRKTELKGQAEFSSRVKDFRILKKFN